MFRPVFCISLVFGLLASVLGCAEEADERSRQRGPIVERLDSAFEALECPASTDTDSFSPVEFARIEAARAKVDAGAAFRSAHALRLAAACAPADEGLRDESAEAYRTLRSQVARSALGASRSRTTKEPKAERAYLVDLAELVRLILPEDAAIAERRIRQIDLASRKH